MTKISKRKKGYNDSRGAREQDRVASDGKEMSLNEFFGDAPYEAAELYAATWKEEISVQSQTSRAVATRAYASAIVTVFSFTLKVDGIDRAYELIRPRA